MAQNPAINDSFNDLLYKLAKNLWDAAGGVGTGTTEPRPGWTDHDYLKSAVSSSALL